MDAHPAYPYLESINARVSKRKRVASEIILVNFQFPVKSKTHDETVSVLIINLMKITNQTRN